MQIHIKKENVFQNFKYKCSVQSLGILWKESNQEGAKDCENSCITESLYLRVIIVDGFVVVVTRVADVKDHNIAGVRI